MEGFHNNHQVRRVSIIGHLFDQEMYGKILSHLLDQTPNLEELDLSDSCFAHSLCFYELC
jgi:hypothetical protein